MLTTDALDCRTAGIPSRLLSTKPSVKSTRRASLSTARDAQLLQQNQLAATRDNLKALNRCAG